MIVCLRQTGQMDPVERSQAVDTEGRRLIDVAGRHPDRPVPTCPDWTARDLLVHVGNVWQSLDAMLRSESTDPPEFGGLVEPPDDDAARTPWAEGVLGTLVATIAVTDPTLPRWTWTHDQTADFLQRRAHQETLVHRVDAELAADDRTPVAASHALDGIEELFSVLVRPTGEGMPSGSFHLHQTDGEGEFMLAVVDGVITVTHEHGKGDAALRGTAEDLWLAVWRRGEMDHMEFFGDVAVAEQWTGLAP